MSDHSKSIIQRYIAKILDIQEKQKDNFLTEQDLRLISEDLNLTSEDLALIEQEFEGHLNRGKGFIRYENWSDAIDELEQGRSLKPYHAYTTALLASAYQQLYYEKKQKNNKQKALEYARQTLQVDSKNDTAFRIISELEKGVSKPKQSNTGRTVAIAVGILAIMFLILGFKSLIMIVVVVFVFLAILLVIGVF